MKQITLLIFIIVLALSAAHSQTTITGIITSAEDGTTLPGVNIIVKGTTTGTTTDINGNYKINVPKDSKQLSFSSLGFKTQTINITNQIIINVSLENDLKQLDEVVVTALGIKREKKALGYSVQEIGGNDLQTTKDVSLANQLAGKAAGVQVSATTGGPGSSSRIVLRGSSSLEGNNQALIVIDGVPVENNTTNTTSKWGGVDYGNGVSDINADDIESISVLKGASAAALYGSSAANGVLLITTKKGTAQKGIGVSVNSNTTFEQASILTKLQNKYGAGRNGKFEGPWVIENGTPVYNPNSAAAYGSWGPKMEGQTIKDWDGLVKTFSPQPNNYSDYYKTGITLNNSVSLNGGNEKATFRLSFNNVNTRDIVPNTTLTRSSITLRSSANLTKKWTVDASANYVIQSAKNRLGLSNSFSAPRNIIFMPRNISDESLSNNIMDENGKETTWFTNWNWMSNPYWQQKYELNSDQRDRVIAYISSTYSLAENLSLLMRTSTDFHFQTFKNRQAYNGISNSLGSYSVSEQSFFQNNADMLLNYSKTLDSNFTISANVGGSINNTNSESSGIATNGGLSVPYFYNVQYSLKPQNVNYFFSEKRVYSVFGSGQVAFRNYLFLDFTGRNDWSSTLPENMNSYFYPSLSSGFVFTDAFHIKSKILSFGKIRASWAQVGNDTDPYRLNKTYTQDATFNGSPIIHVTGTIPSLQLKPEITSSIEAGTDVRLYNNRIGIDFTYYYELTKNQILATDISSTSGATKAIINSGEIKNQGIELQLKTTPILIDKIWKWDLNFNFGMNRSMVLELAPGLESYLLLEHWGLSIEARPGAPYGDIVGYAIKRDASGNKLVDANGMYIRDEQRKVLGNYNPDWTGGISNSISYKRVTLSFLIDMKIGGQMFAGTNMYGYGYSGNFEQTLPGREEWYASEQAREAAGISPANWAATGGYLAEGVTTDGQPNKVYVNPEKYWGQFSEWGKEIHEPFIFDATFVKLRELSIAWQLPQNFTNKLKFKSGSIAVVGRNLWLIYSKVPNIDPESSYTNGNGQGYEIYSYPVRRSIGFNLKFDF